LDRERIKELREEIAALQRENELYRSLEHHTLSEVNTHALRRFRLLAIQEELLALNGREQRIQ
jgi:hypothetical protein